MHQFQKMQMKDFGRLGLQLQNFPETDCIRDRAIIQNLSAEGIIVSKGGQGISQMMGLLAVNQDLARPSLVTLRGMLVMILVTIITVQQVIFQGQEALVLEVPCQTEVEEARCLMKVP